MYASSLQLTACTVFIWLIYPYLLFHQKNMNIMIIKVFNQNSTWKQRLVVWPPDNALLDLSGSDRGINTNIYISTHSAKYFLFSYHIFSIQMTKCSVCLTVLTQMRHLTHCLLCDLSWWSSSWARLGNSRPHCPHL